jgi:hypothetical protein
MKHHKRHSSGEPSGAQRHNFEGHVSNRGHSGAGKLAGHGMNPNQIGGQERSAGRAPMSGEAYKNEIDEPRFQRVDHKMVPPLNDLGMMRDCSDFKREAAGQAHGQAGEDGCRRDEKKITSQFRPVYSDDIGY